MNYKNSKHIKNRRIGESELDLLYGAFSQLCEGDKKGCICVTVKGLDFGEFSSGDRSALDEMKMRRKAVSEVEFSYRSEDYESRVYVSLRDEFSSGLRYYGMSLSLDSSDGQWFDATWKKMGDVLDAIPRTSFTSQFLNKTHGVVSFVISLLLVFCTMRLFFSGVDLCGVTIPEKFNILFVFVGIVLGVFYCVLISDFVCHTYPIIDLDIYKYRSETRRRCARFFWWFMGVIGSLTIATYWPLGGRNGETDGKMSSVAISAETNRTAVTHDIQEQVDCDKGSNQ